MGIYACFAKLRRPTRGEMLPLALAGLLGIAVYHAVFNYAAREVTAGTSSLFISSAPVFGALLAVPLLGERISVRRWVGIAVAFCGIGLLAVGREGGLHVEPVALLLVVCAGCIALWVLIQKKWLGRLRAVEFTAYGFWVGTLSLLVFSGEAVQGVMTAPWRHTAEVVYLGVFSSAVAYLAFAYATTRLPAARVMSFMYLQPAVAMLIAWGYLGEVPTGLSLVGGGLALVGVAIVNKR